MSEAFDLDINYFWILAIHHGLCFVQQKLMKNR